jgi:outer membrane lipoprotein-sorting protein
MLLKALRRRGPKRRKPPSHIGWMMHRAAVVAAAAFGTMACAAGDLLAQDVPATRVADEPEAHARYDEMIRSLRRSRSLNYEAVCTMWAEGMPASTGRCRVWLAKPNYFRVESIQDGRTQGVLVGDGHDLWICWPGGPPSFFAEVAVEAEPQENTYLTKPTPQGAHSILHEAVYIGINMVFDASTFHGYTDSLQPYLDGVRSIGTEDIDGEPCDVIELSYLDGQRFWRIWLGRDDSIPRKFDETVTLANPVLRSERWVNVRINEPIEQERFRWRRPAGWVRGEWPSSSWTILKPGRKAPDFELKCADGSTRRLAECGDVVWLVFWRFG